MSDYYDIDDILLEGERIPTRFKSPALHLGMLDPSSGSDNIEQGAEVDMPLWLALALAQRAVVSLKLPSYFSSAYQSHLLADAQVLNIADKCAHFYELGVKMSMLMANPKLPGVLKKAFHSRYLDIIDTSTNLGPVDYTEHIRKLTATERKLFHMGHKAAAEVVFYKRRSTDKLAPSAIISKKRRRALLNIDRS